MGEGMKEEEGCEVKGNVLWAVAFVWGEGPRRYGGGRGERGRVQLAGGLSLCNAQDIIAGQRGPEKKVLRLT